MLSSCSFVYICPCLGQYINVESWETLLVREKDAAIWGKKRLIFATPREVPDQLARRTTLTLKGKIHK